MRTLITAEGFDLSDTLRDSVRREIGRFVQSVRRPVNVISVRLVDDRGQAVRGLAKRCHVSVQYEDDCRAEGSDAEADFDASVPEAFVKAMRPS
jgi:hypothetical protein